MDSNAKCRVCTAAVNTEDDNCNLLQQPELAHKFAACTSLTVDAIDELPSALCQLCCDRLEKFYAFRTLCIEADERWRAQKLAPAVPFDDEKPIYDLEEQQPDDLTVAELGLENVKQSVFAVSGNKRRGRPPKCRRQPAIKVESPVEENQIETDLSAAKDDGAALPVKRLATQSAPSYQCDVCPTRFFVEHRLVAHKRRHDGLVPYPCTQAGCERGFNRLHCLSEHLKQHAGTGSWFACEQEGCDKTYKHKPTLVMHMRKCHKLGPELKSHVCEFCGKVFKSSAVLNDHRYTHKDKSELPHACQEQDCPRRFSSKEKLKVHMLRHAGIKNFICPYCGMRKTTRNELKIHINYHTLERTWPCRYCAKVCNSAGNLKMHVRTVHERARDYACSFCERTFAKPDTRKYHEMTHTGEKPHECQECGKRFTQPAALRTHRKIHQRQSDERNAKLATPLSSKGAAQYVDLTSS